MTRPLKRAIQTDYRARSPKRRKVDSSVYDPESQSPFPEDRTAANSQGSSQYCTREITWEEQLTLPKRFREEEGVWPARAILKERRKQRRIEYLVDWERHPRTNEKFRPTWEPKKNLRGSLISEWEEENKPRQPSSNSSYTPEGSLGQSLEDGIEDSLNELETLDTGEVGDLRTPSLVDRESESSAEDELEPESPSLEIEETQAQSSLSVSTETVASNFTLEIPAATFDKSEYGLYTGNSQSSQSINPPAESRPEAQSAPGTPSRSRGPSVYYSPVESTPQILSAYGSGKVGSLHERGREPFTSPSARDQVQIPVSSENQQTQAQDSGASSGPVIQESSAENQTCDETQLSGSHQLVPSQAEWSPSVNPTQEEAERNLPSTPQPHPFSGAQVSEPTGADLIEGDPQDIEHIVLLPETQSRTSPPWQFESQLPEIRHVATPIATRQGLSLKQLLPSPLPNMDLPTIRQSPRLQSATPVSRTRSPQRAQQIRRARTPQASGEATNAEGFTANMVTSPLATAPPHIADYTSPPSRYENDANMSDNQASAYDQGGVSALPIQQSIEEELQSSAEDIASKASSSQASLLNERIIPQVDGVSLPTQPVIGPGEWVIGLPAEGKVQSVYTDHINAKRKLIIKFIHRRGSVGSANGSTSRTIERNEMIELMERLQDTTTHLDLGLPNFTQYSIRSEEEMVYAEYAGSKFVFLGELIKIMKRVDCSLVIACKQGPVQDLLADYLNMRQVQVRRHDRPPPARTGTPEALRDTLKVDIVSTTSDKEIHLSAPPAIMIAFDSSFDNQSQHIRRIRELYSKGRNQPLAVIHLLVTNSAEHIDRCLRKAMPSPQRLKLLVRGTYLAQAYLGGSLTYVQRPGDEPEDRPMAMHDLNRAVRKSPNRKLTDTAAVVAMAALAADFEEHWTIPEMPDVHYDEMEDTPPKSSETTTAAGTAAPTPRDGRMRTRSPISRSTTPMGKKRTLDIDAASSLLHKRQRLTPMRDTTPTAESSRDHAKIENLQEQLKAMAIELATEKRARLEAEDKRDAHKQELTEQSATLKQWQNDHAGILRRYERQREINRTLYNENKRITATNESVKAQTDKIRETNTKIRGENTQLKKDLADARSDLTSAGGDIAALETAREEARTANTKLYSVERSLENTKRDFEFTRQQYQQASTRAAELSTQTEELEQQNAQLKIQASNERRRLADANNYTRSKRDAQGLDQLTIENKALHLKISKLMEENKLLNKNRGVQTRGSSAQPPNSPGLGNLGRRSRQASPAVGARAMDREGGASQRGGGGGSAAQGGHETLMVPSGGRDRVSAVRNEP